VKNYDTKIN